MVTTWKERIKEAEKRRHFTNVDAKMAGSWKSCPVGEKTGGKSPTIDSPMELLGCDFAFYVNIDEIKTAKRIYNEIQKL